MSEEHPERARFSFEATPEERIFGGDEEAAERERDREEEAAQRSAFLERLLADPAGRAWLREILTEFRVFEPTLAASPGGAPDSLASFYYLGIRDAGWRIWRELDDLHPVLASQMRREKERR